MTHADLPATRNDFLLASLAKPGDTHTLPGQAPSTITKVEEGTDLNFRRRVLIYTEASGPVPIDYSPRAYIPVTPA